jgi:trk system potassium uptake protein TrkH
MRLNYLLIGRLLSFLLFVNGLLMLLCLPASFAFDDGMAPHIAVSAVVNIALAGLLRHATRKYTNKMGHREGYLVVFCGWVLMTLTGTLPYVLSGALGESFTRICFETVSGYTTTGATILETIEGRPESILLWRSITQWIGGMGIIVLAVAILPLLGVGGMQLFVAESPGPSADKLHPRIKETARRLWQIYLLLTVCEIILLSLGGMSVFEAVCHSFTTVSTGGFSTRNASIASFDSPYIEWVVIAFMFLSGVNFTLTYFLLRGEPNRLLKNEEFHLYLVILMGSVAAISLIRAVDAGSISHEAVRDSCFQVVSLTTTTGFVTSDYARWPIAAGALLLLLMFTGGSAGSTSGGIKVIRHLIVLKHSWLELTRLIQPNAVVPVRFNRRVVSERITFNIHSFFLLYLFFFVVGLVFIAITDGDWLTSIGASIACLGNIGPGWGSVGPAQTYSKISNSGLWGLGVLMLLGRLELFTVLVLCNPKFWRR